QVGAEEVVVDGLGDADEVEAAGPFDLQQGRGDAHGAVAADDDQRVEAAGAVVLQAAAGDVRRGLGAGEAVVEGVGLVGGAEDGAADGEDVGNVRGVEVGRAVLDQSEEAVVEADDLDVVEAGVLGDGADDRVEAGAVAAA